ncbi:MAG TPA: hypothetical protein VIP11_10090 [Gemmatimonadaceae bacterium]
MRIAVVVVTACVIAASTASSGHRKDRAAMMIYEGRDRVVALLPADTANLTMILSQLEGDTVAAPQLADRPCIGVALFSNREWAALTATRKPSEVRPSEATLRLRIYPATANARVAVENLQERHAYVAEGGRECSRRC